MLSYLSYLSVLLDHPVCFEYFYLPLLLKALYAHEISHLKPSRIFNAKRILTLCKLSKPMGPQLTDVQKLLKYHTGPPKPCWQY